jgi:hypothetical protein
MRSMSMGLIVVVMVLGTAGIVAADSITISAFAGADIAQTSNLATPSVSANSLSPVASASAFANLATLSIGAYASSPVGAHAGASSILREDFLVAGFLNTPCGTVSGGLGFTIGCLSVEFTMSVSGDFNATPSGVSPSFVDFVAASTGFFPAASPNGTDFIPLVTGTTATTYSVTQLYRLSTPQPLGTFASAIPGSLQLLLQVVPSDGTADFSHTASVTFGLAEGTTLTTAYNTYTAAPTLVATPEPATMFLLGGGVIGASVRRRFTQRRA